MYNNKPLSWLLIGLSIITLAACNSGGNSAAQTPAYQTKPVSSYTNVLTNLSGTELVKLVVNDANFKAVKTITNLNCQKNASCGINDADMANAASFEFYDAKGQLVSATLVRTGATSFYADDAHLGYYLEAKVKSEKRNDIIALIDDSYDQAEILGRDYRLYVQFNSNVVQADSVKKILIDTKGQKVVKTPAAVQSGTKALQGTFAGGNSACLETAKQLGAVGELGGAITKFTDAMGAKNGWFEAVGGIFKFASAFTNGGCDISNMTMTKLNEIDAKLDTVIANQNIALDAMGNISSRMAENEIYKHINKMDGSFDKLAVLNKNYMRSFTVDGHQLENLSDYVAYYGGIKEARPLLEGIMKNVHDISNQVQILSKTDATSDLGLFWKFSNDHCNPNANGNLVENLAFCSYGTSKVIYNNLPEIIKSEQILASVESFMIAEKKITDNTPESKDYIQVKAWLNSPALGDEIKKNYTLPYANAITEHYKNTDNFFVIANDKKLDWVKFIDNIAAVGSLSGYVCEVKSFMHTAVSGDTAEVYCYTPTDKTKPAFSQTVTNIQKSYGKYEYVLSPNNPNKFVENLPRGNWREVCKWQDAEMIGPRDSLFGNNRMILKTQCKNSNNGNGEKYSYIDLRTKIQPQQQIGATPFTTNGMMQARNAYAYEISSWSGHLDVSPGWGSSRTNANYTIIPSGTYLNNCVVEYVNITEDAEATRDGVSYAHAIVSCWVKPISLTISQSQYGSLLLAFGKPSYQSQLRYKLHKQNYGYTTDTQCNLNNWNYVNCWGVDVIDSGILVSKDRDPEYFWQYGITNPVEWATAEVFNSFGRGDNHFYNSSVSSPEDTLAYVHSIYTDKHQQFWRKVEALYPKND